MEGTVMVTQASPIGSSNATIPDTSADLALTRESSRPTHRHTTPFPPTLFTTRLPHDVVSIRVALTSSQPPDHRQLPCGSRTPSGYSERLRRSHDHFTWVRLVLSPPASPIHPFPHLALSPSCSSL